MAAKFQFWRSAKWFGFGANADYDSALRLLRQANFAEAANALERVLAERPEPATRSAAKRILAPTLTCLAEQEIASKQPKLAAEHLARAVELFPQYPDYRLEYARALRAYGAKTEAYAELGEALQIRPNYVTALVQESLWRAQDDDWDAAFDAAEQAQARSKEADQNLVGFARECFLNGDKIRAIENLARLAPNNRPNADIAERASALAESRDFEKAVVAYDEAVAAQPGYADWRCQYGQALVELERYDDAAEQFRAAIELNPRYADAHAQLGICLRATGHDKEAREEFNIALECDKSHPIALIEAARLRRS